MSVEEVVNVLGDVFLHDEFAHTALDALERAGYAVVKLPEGVEVPHGARLVERGRFGGFYDVGGGPSRPMFTIEDTP